MAQDPSTIQRKRRIRRIKAKWHLLKAIDRIFCHSRESEGDQDWQPTGSKPQDILQNLKASVTASFFLGFSSRSIWVRPLESEGNVGSKLPVCNLLGCML